MNEELNNKGHNSPEMVALTNIKNLINEKLIKFREKNEEAIKDYEKFKEKYKKFLHIN